jgi:hypothetical protein
MGGFNDRLRTSVRDNREPPAGPHPGFGRAASFGLTRALASKIAFPAL